LKVDFLKNLFEFGSLMLKCFC